MRDEKAIAALSRLLNEQGPMIQRVISDLVKISYGSSKACGWHTPKTMACPNCSHQIEAPGREPGTMIALMHSELSEALEGIRKNMMDEHIPTRKSVEVELADLAHRIFDFAGKYNLDIGGAYVQKGFYNLVREDHKPEVRNAEGGKAF